MRTLRFQESLSRRDILLRGFVVTAAVSALGLLRVVDPSQMPASFLFPISCGAVTGLPCLFCGTTRALHYLLNGEVARALYFNWLAVPMTAALLVACLIGCAEIILRSRIVRWLQPKYISGRGIGIVTLLVAGLWVLQVYLALSQHKHELLNPAGPLYATFVR